ncbi:Uncharacterised protein [Providencia rettgeri]|uniref:Uncharacterized protein n=1 Tax=Providencia rettgeri TaxID=587 RepID=A0A264VVJ2_PRORE|nr:hypothetical protein [Providencia rettgeri]OZS75364.1 hypothetical protein CHI95_07630 [Providencia rettgeri]SPZ24005.1 Uncharacterised protein [Providencia rettgeri]
MSSLSNNSIPVQLRSSASPDGSPHLQYELMVQNQWIPVNRRYVEWAVGNLNVIVDFNSKGKGDAK